MSFLLEGEGILYQEEEIGLWEGIEGMAAAADGEGCPPGASSSFKRGYAIQYELEAIQDGITQLESMRNMRREYGKEG